MDLLSLRSLEPKTKTIHRRLISPAFACRCAVAAVLFGAAAVDVVVDAEAPHARVQVGTRVHSIVFASDLAVPGSVKGSPIELAPGARVVFERSAGVANQTIAGELELIGDATFVNDNSWTHMAHMLRIEGRIVGTGDITIDGAGDGGVLLAVDSRTSYSGAIGIQGGNLVVGHPGALGSTEVGTSLSGGQLSLYGAGTDDPLEFTGDASIHTGVDVTLGGDVTVANGVIATLDTGGGNTGRLVGSLRGRGDFVFRGGGRNPQLALAPFTLGGTEPNALAGRITVERGTLALAKPPGVPAVVGELRLGGGSNLATIRLDADDQIADGTDLELVGPQSAMLWSNGHSETLGTLRLGTDGSVRMGPGADRVSIADCSDAAWGAGHELIIEGWNGELEGGGEDQLRFGENERGLAPAQLAAVGFLDPAGRAPGLYRARLAANGETLPDRQVEPDARNAFAIGAKADEARAALYAPGGLQQLGELTSSLEPNSTISFFGDSITWQHGFAGKIEQALSKDAGDREIRVMNRGINGGGAPDLVNGSPRSAHEGGRPGASANAPQASFREVLAVDQPAAVVIFIGINDVTWKGTTLAQFDAALTSLITSARDASAKVVVATLLLNGERPDGSNPDDDAIERFAERTRSIARREGATLVDLRRAAIAWLQNHNRRLRLDGTLEFDDLGHLTYDGIHPTDTGNQMIAEQVADGLCRALGR